MSNAPFPSTTFSQTARDAVARGAVHQSDRPGTHSDRPDPHDNFSVVDRCAKRRAPLTDQEIQSIANRLSRYSRRAQGDVALLYLMLSTGAKPLELARLQVKDVIAPNGTVRGEASIPAIAAINGIERPAFFKSGIAIEAILAYVQYRVAQGQGVGRTEVFAGLDPSTPLLLDHEGRPYEIMQSPDKGNRFLCRGILEACRRIFRLSGIDGLCAATMRRTLASRLSARGATIEQIGEALGIRDRQAVRDLLDLHPIDLPTLFEEIVSPKGTTPRVDPH